MIGTKLAHYEITGHLGSGGMGEVYQATDTKLGRPIAIGRRASAGADQRECRSRRELECRGHDLIRPRERRPVSHCASEGEAVAVTHLKDQSSHRFPEFLPDGKRFLFYVQSTPEIQGVYLGSLDGGEPKRLTAADSA